jgi:pyruvate/2-oxoglutarate/acetoin dehydrogenase E1 component/TPP-dependent pyruvate/acetoin dehydrogenase alpha subunit
MMGKESLSGKQLIDMYEKMLLIRSFEEKLYQLYSQGKLQGLVHISAGQEAVAVGVCAALERGDYIVGSHRSHGHCLARGCDPQRLMSEIMGKESGYCGGRGGSMHLAAYEIGILGTSAIVGGGVPLAVGAALSAKLRKTSQVAVAFFGDGAFNQGVVCESMNLAALWKLPVIFICEDNQYAITVRSLTPTKTQPYWSTAGDPVSRAQGFGMPGTDINGMDVLAVYDATNEAVDRARRGAGPSFIHCTTYRYYGHSVRSAILGPYRTQEEMDEWKAKDPINTFEKRLVKEGVLDFREIEKTKDKTRNIIEKAVEFAETGPYPTELVEVFSGKKQKIMPKKVMLDLGAVKKIRELSFIEAIREAMCQEMSRDNTIFVMGEDVGVRGGPFLDTLGFFEKFGPEKIRDTPISEAAFIGAGVGAAITGLRPIVQFQFSSFFGVCMDQIHNQAAKLKYIYGKEVPLVIRTRIGCGFRYGPQHSETLYSVFAHSPGLICVVPSTPFDAKGLLITSIRSDDPVMFFEHEGLFKVRGPVPEEPYEIPFGKAAIRREGTDVTVVGLSKTVHLAIEAAKVLEKEGVSCEVLDPRTIVPFDEETVLKSVRKTGKLVVIDEDYERCGFASWLISLVTEKAIDCLDKVKKVTMPNMPIPTSPALEDKILITVDKVVTSIKELA